MFRKRNGSKVSMETPPIVFPPLRSPPLLKQPFALTQLYEIVAQEASELSFNSPPTTFIWGVSRVEVFNSSYHLAAIRVRDRNISRSLMGFEVDLSGNGSEGKGPVIFRTLYEGGDGRGCTIYAPLV